MKDVNRFLLIREEDLENLYQMVDLFRDAVTEIFQAKKIQAEWDDSDELPSVQTFYEKQSTLYLDEAEKELKHIF